MANVAAVVFAHNEETSLVRTLEILNRFKKERRIRHIIVVNDGSTDATGKIAKNAGAIVVTHTENLGKREAFISGAIAARKLGVEVMINLDADITKFPRTTMDNLIKTTLRGGKLMSVAAQYEAYPATPGKNSRTLNLFSNAQRAINLKALEPLFNGNPKWWDLLRAKRARVKTNTLNDEVNKKGQKWGLEFALGELIPKKKTVILDDPVFTKHPFRNPIASNSTPFAQSESRRIVKDRMSIRNEKAFKLKLHRGIGREWAARVRTKALNLKARRKAINILRMKRRTK